MEGVDSSEIRAISRLEIQTIDSAAILLTEDNLSKRTSLEKELSGDTFYRTRTAIESGKTDEIPPIVVLKNPFISKENTKKAYREYIKLHPRQGGRYFDNEDMVLDEILNTNAFLCYNGNRRLEEFQRAKTPIRAYIIKTQEEFMQMPPEERRIPDKLKEQRPYQYQIDQNYLLSFLVLLDATVYLLSQKRYWDTLDFGNLIKEMLRARRQKQNKG